MNCPKCGALVVAEAVFCQQCGERLDPETDQAQDNPAAAPSPARSPAQKLRPSHSSPDDDAEEILWRGTYCPQTMVGPMGLAIVVLVASVVVGMLVNQAWLTWLLVVVNPAIWLVIYFYYLYQTFNVRYELTTQRFVHERGVLRRVTDRIEVIDFDDITVEQGPIERLLGIGKVRITSSDRTHPEILLPGIAAVRQVAGQMDDARRAERRRRGLHIESI
jgi:membrane protein YdbS with pleckstrin-like domain